MTFLELEPKSNEAAELVRAMKSALIPLAPATLG